MAMYLTSRLLPLALVMISFSGVDILFRGKAPGDPWSYTNLAVMLLMVGVLSDILYRGRFKLTPAIAVSFALLIVGFLAGVGTGYSPVVNGTATIRGFVVLFAIHQVVRKDKEWEKVQKSLIIGSLIVAVSIMLQEAIFLLTGRSVWGAQFKSDYIFLADGQLLLRASGFVNDPNTAALYLIAGLVCLEAIGERKLSALGDGVLWIALFLTFSRGGILAAVIWQFLRIQMSGKVEPRGRKLVLGQLLKAGIVVVVGGLVFIYRGNESRWAGDISTGRYKIWLDSFDLFFQHPFWGGGFGAFQAQGVASHNLALEVLLSTGLVGFGLFSALLLSVLARREIHYPFYRPQWAYELLLVLLCASFFLSTFTNLMLWVAIGLATNVIHAAWPEPRV